MTSAHTGGAIAVKLALLERAGTVGLWSLLELGGDRYCIPSKESATSMRVSSQQVTADVEEVSDEPAH